MERHDYNPDVLNCLANLSNDEVKTPPAVAVRMLDLLPPELFTSPTTTFLDPFTKSGVFLREIVKRLDRGLEKLIPDRRERIDHILQKQAFGIATTELSAHLSRRTLYCSKDASSQYSVSRFATPDGNLRYRPLRHTWSTAGKCIYCGASQGVYDRGDQAEQYAYEFIHTDNPKKLFNMKFDVIIGNPPYQLADGSGGASDSAIPIYNKFVEQTKKLNPSFLLMIIPSKWMVGGRGLQSFRNEMLADNHIKKIFDFEDASECFPGIHIDGGICYFLWEKSYNGDVEYTFKSNDGHVSTAIGKLQNKFFDFVIRDQRIVPIINKTANGHSFSEIVSNTRPFGIRNFLFNNPERYPESNLQETPFKDAIRVFGVKGIKGGARRKIGYIKRKTVTNNEDCIDKFKLFFTTSYSTNAIHPPEIIIGSREDVCTETFLLVGPFDTESEQLNCKSYMETKFFKVLLYFGKGTMHVTKSVFGLIPLVDFSHPWTDEMLYKKYGLDPKEIEFIEGMIRPME